MCVWVMIQTDLWTGNDISLTREKVQCGIHSCSRGCSPDKAGAVGSCYLLEISETLIKSVEIFQFYLNQESQSNNNFSV